MLHGYKGVVGSLVSNQIDVLHTNGITGHLQIVRKLAQAVSNLINMKWYKHRNYVADFAHSIYGTKTRVFYIVRPKHVYE
jgi:hypothetical protein